MKYLTLPVLAASLIAPAQARWFEVEVILFSRIQDPTQLDEDFEAPRASKVNAKSLDLFSAFLLAPDDCPQPEPPAPPLAALADEGLALIGQPFNPEQPLGSANELTEEQQVAELLEQPQAAADDVEQGVRYDEFGFPIADDTTTALAESELEPERTPEEQLAYEQWLSDCQKPRSYDELSQLPVAMTPHQIPEWDQGPYLLSADLLQLSEAREKLANGGAYKPMLHAGWRIDIDSKRRMPAIKLIAGHNFGSRYSADGWEHPVEQPEETLIGGDDSSLLAPVSDGQDAESQQLASPESEAEIMLPATTGNDGWQEVDLNNTPIEYKPAVWELEADLHIWLATWLHIETDLVLRRSGRKSPQELEDTDAVLLPTESTSTLVSDAATVPYLFNYNMSQFRRVRSSEIHYFDHPMFGMILQIRPYEPRPEPEQPPETEINTVPAM
nr:CsiV family protein [Neiella litorisoli]